MTAVRNLSDLLATADGGTLAYALTLATIRGGAAVRQFGEAVEGRGRAVNTVREAAPGPPPRDGLVWNETTHRWRDPDTDTHFAHPRGHQNMAFVPTGDHWEGALKASSALGAQLVKANKSLDWPDGMEPAKQRATAAAQSVVKKIIRDIAGEAGKHLPAEAVERYVEEYRVAMKDKYRQYAETVAAVDDLDITDRAAVKGHMADLSHSLELLLKAADEFANYIKHGERHRPDHPDDEFHKPIPTTESHAGTRPDGYDVYGPYWLPTLSEDRSNLVPKKITDKVSEAADYDVIPPELLAAVLVAQSRGDTESVAKLKALAKDKNALAAACGHLAESIDDRVQECDDPAYRRLSEADRSHLVYDRTKKRWVNPNKKVPVRKTPAGQMTPKETLVAGKAAAEPARQAARAAWTHAVGNPHELTGDHFAALADHLPTLTRDELRGTLKGLVKNSNGLKQDLVDRLLAHVGAKTTGDTTHDRRANQTPMTPAVRDVFTVPVDSLKVDPTRFQYKISGIGAGGVTNELKGAETWEPKFGGVLLVWRDPADGQDYVVNGHHRHDIATRLNAGTVNVRYITADTAMMARASGALANIAEGNGTATDAAKYLRDTGSTVADLRASGISLSGRLAGEAVTLSALSDGAFQAVANGAIPEGTAVAVAKHLKDHGLQDALFRKLRDREDNGKDWSTQQIETAAKKMASAGTTTVAVKNLFDDFEDEQSTFDQEVELEFYIGRQLSGEANDFGALASKRRANRVAGAGNTLNTDENARLRDELRSDAALFDQHANLVGPVSAAVKVGAAKLAQAKTKKEKDDAKSETLVAVRAAVAGIGRSEPVPTDAGTEGGTRGVQPDANGVAPGGAGAAPAEVTQDEPGFTGVANNTTYIDGVAQKGEEEPTGMREQPVGTPVDDRKAVRMAMDRMADAPTGVNDTPEKVAKWAKGIVLTGSERDDFRGPDGKVNHEKYVDAVIRAKFGNDAADSLQAEDKAAAEALAPFDVVTKHGTARHEDELEGMKPNTQKYVGGYLVTRNASGGFAIQHGKSTFAGGDAGKIAQVIRDGHLQHKWQSKRVAKALQRHANHEDAVPMLEQERYDREAKKAASIQDGAAAVSTGDGTYGRVGTVVKGEDGGQRLVFDDSPDEHYSLDYEPLDPEDSWRAGDVEIRRPKPTTGGRRGLFDTPDAQPAPQAGGAAGAGKEPWQMTADEFHAAEVKKLAATYKLTPEVAAQKYGRNAAHVRRMQSVMAAADAGQRIPDAVLDADPDLRRRILHDYPDTHTDYRQPEARQPVSADQRIDAVGNRILDQHEQPASTLIAKAQADMRHERGRGLVPSEIQGIKDAHRKLINDRLLFQKSVPSEVLADYPDLAASHPEAAGFTGVANNTRYIDGVAQKSADEAPTNTANAVDSTANAVNIPPVAPQPAGPNPEGGSMTTTDKVNDYRTTPPTGFTVAGGSVSGILNLKSDETGWRVVADPKTPGVFTVATSNGKQVGRYGDLDAALAHATTTDAQTDPTPPVAPSVAAPKPAAKPAAGPSEKQQAFAKQVQARHLSQIDAQIGRAEQLVSMKAKDNRDTAGDEAQLAQWRWWRTAVAGVSNPRRILDAEHLDFARLSPVTADIYAAKLGLTLPKGGA